MKKLPIGIQTFREIIEGGYLYADKTRFVYNLLTGVKCYFLSRPRRFGKSLLLDTIAEVFGGNRALFRGLWIDGTDYDFQNYPVIRLDMSTMTTKDADALEQSIMDRLCVLCKAEGIEIESSLLSSVFLGLIEGLHKKYGRRVAVLVDEYDKPVLDYILDTEIADANRQVIKNFFGVLKGMDAHLRFTFFTGVSKFTKTSLFSELNNLTDITLEDDFAAICGFTAQDITELFNEHLAALRAQKQFAQWPANGEGSVYDQIFKWYDGYSWDGETHVFNPFSLLQFFQNRRFSSYWYASGSPSFLIKLIKDNPAAYTDMDQAMINEDDLDATADLTRLSPVSLMFQTGYLTVKAIEWDSNGSADYYLKTPNREVRAAFGRHVLKEFTEAGELARSAYQRIRRALAAGDAGQFEAILHGLFASIPYELHVDMEAYYHSIFYAIMQLMGFQIQAEVSVARGRIDGVLELPMQIYVMEFKYRKHDGTDEPDALLDAALADAMRQINARGYCDRYVGGGKTVYKTAVAVVGRDAVRVLCESLS